MFKKFQKSISEIPAWLMTANTVATILMNLLANKSIETGVSWLALDSGILVSWVSFMTMDIITKQYGAKASVNSSIFASIANIMSASVLFSAGTIKGVWGEAYNATDFTGVNSALDATLEGNMFVLFGSTVAFLLASIVNSTLNEAIGKVVEKNNYSCFMMRSSVSTVLGQFTDNLLFALIVSHTLFGWTLTQCLTCSITGALVEMACEFVALPFGYKIVKTLSQEANSGKTKTRGMARE